MKKLTEILKEVAITQVTNDTISRIELEKKKSKKAAISFLTTLKNESKNA